MSDKLIPSPHILFAFRNKGLTAVDAVSEFIDNNPGNKFKIEFEPNNITVLDNGTGISDMNSIFGLGYSYSKYDPANIGEFGIGSKDAQMHFASRCKAETIYKGKYYCHSIDWEQIEKSSEWPDKFTGTGQPVNKAPAAIRKGGTMLTLTRLQAQRRRINMEALVKRLTQRYRPGLIKGDEIVIVDSRQGQSKSKTYKLDSSLAAIGLEGATTNISGSVEGRKFTLMYSLLKEYDQMLNGVHFGFGKRFILTSRYLGETAMPSRLYAEVMLGDEWKSTFSPNKTKIVQYWNELQAAVLVLLEDFVKKLQAHVEHVRIEHVNLSLANDFENVVVLDPTKPGKHVAGTAVKATGVRGEDEVENPDPHVDEVLAEQTDKDDGHATQNRKSRRGGISFRRNDGLGAHTASASVYEKNRLYIELNGTFEIIKLAYEPPYKPVTLWPVIAREFAEFCKQNVDKLDTIMPTFIDKLNQLGYQIELDHPDVLANKMFAYIMKQCPLTVAERRKISNIHVVENTDDTDDEEAVGGAAS